jgi:hypothetical protein
MLCQENQEGRQPGKVYCPIKYLCSSVSTNHQVGLEIPASKLQSRGKYYLVIEALWNKHAKGEYQAFCVQLLAKMEIDLRECPVPEGLMNSVYVSRAIQGKDKAQVLPYNSRKGAMKIVESQTYESLYGQVCIFNESN